ncbi:MAG: PA2817 family protein [Cellvibrionaceae bacterium]
MHYTQYLADHVDLLKQFKFTIAKHPPYQLSLSELTEADQSFMNTLDALCEANEHTEEIIRQGQWLIDRIVMSYDHLLPFFSRDLMWFFGGSSLHYMSDEEIRFYQQLDELRYAAETQNRPFDIIEAKTYLNQQLNPQQGKEPLA